VKAIKANSSRQTLPNLNSDFELSKLQDENNALKQTSRRERPLPNDSLKREATSIQDENKSLMTAL